MVAAFVPLIEGQSLHLRPRLCAASCSVVHLLPTYSVSGEVLPSVNVVNRCLKTRDDNVLPLEKTVLIMGLLTSLNTGASRNDLSIELLTWFCISLAAGPYGVSKGTWKFFSLSFTAYSRVRGVSMTCSITDLTNDSG